MKFARITFFVASIYGFVSIAPLYFMEKLIGQSVPPVITHSEYFYGFLGVTLAWQAAYLVISRDPARYRALMIPIALEKLLTTVAFVVLYAQNRLSLSELGPSLIDPVFLMLFVIAFARIGDPGSHVKSKASYSTSNS